jgi:hypothetical protein
LKAPNPFGASKKVVAVLSALQLSLEWSDVVETHSVLGFIGDGATFLSGVLLALDAVRGEDEFVQANAIGAGLKNPAMDNVWVKLGNRVVGNEKDVERSFRRKASTKAMLGCIGLTVGFAFLIASRIAEVLCH